MVASVLGLLIRSGLVLGFAELLCWIARHASPGYRHKILLTGFVLLLLWPLFPLFVPEIYIPLAPEMPVQRMVTVQEIIHPAKGSGLLLKPALLLGSVWILGACFVLLSLAIGYARVLMMRRQGVLCADHRLTWLIEELVTRSGLQRAPVVLLLPEYVMPQILGVFRSYVLLPQDCVSWSEAKQTAVLLHEFAHIKRRDMAWQLLANVASAIWWFQPLCWLARRQLRAESEQACDAFVVARGMQRSVYAAELLAIAKSFRLRRYADCGALPMAHPGSLEVRLRSVLNPQLLPLGERPVRGAVLALFALTVGSVGISVAKNGQLISKGGVSMRRTLFSGLLTSASLSAAAIGGSVLDPTGAAVINARASLYNPETKATQETTSMADGKFDFTNLEAGQYILRVEKDGFSPLFRAFKVDGNVTVTRGLILHTGSAPNAQTAAVDSNAFGDEKPIRVGGEQAQSKLISKVNPVYPANAKTNHIQGKVILEAVISADGTPKDLQVISSPSDDLSQSALEAVRQWRYSPTLLNGSPVEIVTDILVNYTLAP